LNPANDTAGPYLPTAPAEPGIHRLHVVADLDAVVVFGHLRLTMPELADLVRQDPTWQGRTLRITGPGGLAPDAVAALAKLLDVTVEADTRVTEVLPASHPVAGGRSFLPGGRQVAWARPGAYVVHVTVRADRFVIEGTEYSVADLAVILRHDDGWHGEELVLATDGDRLSQEAAEELGLHLNTAPVTTHFPEEAE
jgi:hypothetical protein